MSYNLPTSIADPNGYSAQFYYAPDRSRWKQVSTYVGGTETTIYMGGLLEKLTTPTRTHWKHLIATPSGQVQVIRRSDGTTDTVYVTTDHLGSTDAVLNAAGTVLMQGSFGVHGARRASNWQGAPSPTEWQAIADTTRRGYTGHEQIDNVMVVHMTRNGRTHFLNRRRRAHRARTRDGSSSGRVFDPAIGRFLSADPYIDGPETTQGWNRYAYVQGRLMSATDPSGFEATASLEEVVVSEPRQDCGFLALACNGNQRYGLPGPGYFGPPVSPLWMPQVQPSIEEVVVEAERLPQEQKDPCAMEMLPQNGSNDGFYNYGTPGNGAGQYGLPETIQLIQNVGAQWQATGAQPFGIGNMSLQSGGFFPPHGGHMNGLNFDLRPIRSDGAQVGGTTWNSAAYDGSADVPPLSVAQGFRVVRHPRSTWQSALSPNSGEPQE